MSGERKETAKTRLPITLSLIALLFTASSILEFWGFYLTGFRMFTLAVLALAGFLAAVGLLMLKPWGLWISFASYLPKTIQSSSLLWSLTLSEGLQFSVLKLALVAYLILLTSSLVLLWKSRKTLQ